MGFFIFIVNYFGGFVMYFVESFFECNFDVFNFDFVLLLCGINVIFDVFFVDGLGFINIFVCGLYFVKVIVM